LENELKKCTRCDWTGHNAKWVLCSICNQTYYVCPICGSRTVVYRDRPYLYSSVRT
jgi:hypothetical protein